MRLETNHHADYVYEDKDGIVRDRRYKAAAKSTGVSGTAGTAEGQLNGVATTRSDDGSNTYSDEDLADQAA